MKPSCHRAGPRSRATPPASGRADWHSKRSSYERLHQSVTPDRQIFHPPPGGIEDRITDSSHGRDLARFADALCAKRPVAIVALYEDDLNLGRIHVGQYTVAI